MVDLRRVLEPHFQDVGPHRFKRPVDLRRMLHEPQSQPRLCKPQPRLDFSALYELQSHANKTNGRVN